ncbi:TPA: hypothetical protein JRX32_001405 [Elizabethkingia anophelis]|nr:hypothetical protein [Chryseobacterium gambrini]HAY3534799.1 hypothetical protein [Elizabethkingia anophelis]HAY3546915.1 hypothetical protein [Elizabethkingia anophelis]
MNNNIPLIDQWYKVASSGAFEDAQNLYYDKLFDQIISKFKVNHSGFLKEGGVLFSMLGFSPEPIILTARLINPDIHVIFTTNNKNADNSILERFLEDDYEIEYLINEDFNNIYNALKEKMIMNPQSQIVIDITGGKKSMVAAAAIFGKDFGCKVVYVDFTDYIKELRKPRPGSEVMKTVYDPNSNQPEIFL